MEVADELAVNEVVMNKDLETTLAVLDQAMGNVVLSGRGFRPECSLSMEGQQTAFQYI